MHGENLKLSTGSLCMETISHFRYLDYDDTYKAESDVNI